MFTFREEQKPLVSPRKNVAPTYALQPSYSPADHAEWSAFYSRPDLVAQDYMVGSASKVMRAGGQNEENYEGYSSISERARRNAEAAREPNIAIGEPGDSLGMYDGQVGRKTQIGDAINDWKNSSKSTISSRPGDFDFEVPSARTGGQAGDGDILAETAPKFGGKSTPSTQNLPTRSTASSMDPDGPYRAFNDAGEVTRYQVQRGDTLGNISAKPNIYNDASLWPLIYSANRKVIGRNPHALKTDQSLDIPRDFTPAQAKAARARAGSR